MKKNMTKVMAMGMVLTMLAGTTVFAVAEQQQMIWLQQAVRWT
ncbi:MAG: hypothetical protein V8Q32_07970 [Anaerotignum faecicola]